MHLGVQAIEHAIFCTLLQSEWGCSSLAFPGLGGRPILQTVHMQRVVPRQSMWDTGLTNGQRALLDMVHAVNAWQCRLCAVCMSAAIFIAPCAGGLQPLCNRNLAFFKT